MAALAPAETQHVSAKDPSDPISTAPDAVDNPCDSKDDNAESTKSSNETDTVAADKVKAADVKPSADDIKDNSNDEEKKYEPPPNDSQPLIPQNLEPKPLGKKNKVVIGSFEASTFHYSFKNQKDPLQIGMFPVFGYLQVPHIGVYGDSFEPTQLRALMELDLTDKLIANLPDSVRGAIGEIMGKLKDKKVSVRDMFSGFVAVHHCPPFKPSQHFSIDADNLFNVMYHPWLYHEVEELRNEQQLEGSLLCGLFEPQNVYEIRNDPKAVKSEVDRGVPFGRLEERSCFLHGFAFSPCNCDIARDADAGFCAFYMVSCTKDMQRGCVSYHVFANNPDMDEILKWTFKEISTVKELLTAFESLQWGNVAKNLSVLCRHY